MKSLKSSFVLLSVASLWLTVACSDEEVVEPASGTDELSINKAEGNTNARTSGLPAEFQSTAAFCTYSGCKTTFGPSSFYVPLEAIATFTDPLSEDELDLSRPPFEYYDQATVAWFIKGENERDFRRISTDEVGSVGRSRSVRQPRTEVRYSGALFLASANLAPGTYEIMATYTINEQVTESRSEIEIVSDN